MARRSKGVKGARDQNGQIVIAFPGTPARAFRLSSPSPTVPDPAAHLDALLHPQTEAERALAHLLEWSLRVERDYDAEVLPAPPDRLLTHWMRGWLDHERMHEGDLPPLSGVGRAGQPIPLGQLLAVAWPTGGCGLSSFQVRYNSQLAVQVGHEQVPAEVAHQLALGVFLAAAFAAKSRTQWTVQEVGGTLHPIAQATACSARACAMCPERAEHAARQQQIAEMHSAGLWLSRGIHVYGAISAS